VIVPIARIHIEVVRQAGLHATATADEIAKHVAQALGIDTALVIEAMRVHNEVSA